MAATQRPSRYRLPQYGVLFPPSFVCKSCGRIRGGKSGTAAPLVFGTPLVGSVGRVGRCGGLRDFYGLPMRFSVLLPKRNKQHSTSRRKKSYKKKKKPKTWLSVAKENLVYTGSRKGDLLTVLSLTHSHPRCNFSGLSLPKRHNPFDIILCVSRRPLLDSF